MRACRNKGAWVAAAAVLAGLPACAERLPGAPRVDLVTPASAPAGTSLPVVISGEFYLDSRVSFTGDESRLSSAFTARLTGAAAPEPGVALLDVAYVNSQNLTATVPGTLADGVYTVSVVDPAGREGVKTGAFTVGAGPPDGGPDGAPGGPDGGPDAASGTPDAAAGTPDAAPGTPDAGAGSNTPPLPVVGVSPAAGTPATVFTASAAGTVDLEDPASALVYSWDWTNDGTFDSTGPTATHTYGAEGTYALVLRVEDTGGLLAYKTFAVIVTAATSLITVTTGVDESDTGATPASPGGTGLSLREAIAYADGAAGAETVFVPFGTVIPVGSTLPSVSGMIIVGDGAVIDGTAMAGTICWGLGGAGGARILGFEITGCAAWAITFNSGTNVTLSRCHIHDNDAGVLLQSPGNVIGPDNEIDHNAGDAILVNDDNEIRGSSLHHNTLRGVRVTNAADGTQLIGNVIRANDFGGITIDNLADSVLVRHNTVADNLGDGVQVGSGASMTDVRNNVFSGNTGFGLSASSGSLSANDFNDYDLNGAGTCGCALGAGSLTVAPQYIDAAAGDFRLRPDSLLVDAGTDLGMDVNGAAPGLFTGAAPDMGAWESPY